MVNDWRVSWSHARRVAGRALGPVERFFRVEAASGLVLLAATVVALAWSNSPWASSYRAFWGAPLLASPGALTALNSARLLVSDGMMAVFFLLVGLEVRRELHDGELSELRRAMLPVVAAIGGMVVPAAIYLTLNGGSPARKGWGVPMPTDIAFAVGVLALLGARVPPALRILLLAIAVIDDIGALLVIAVAYSPGVSPIWALVALSGVALVIAFQRLRVERAAFYALPGAVIWGGLLGAGVHPTFAGVLLGLLTPVRSGSGPTVERLEARLHPWVAFGVLPMFALANGGVFLRDLHLAAPGSLRILGGVAAGLVLGKPLGVLLACYLAVRLGLAALPDGVKWRGVAVVGMVAGIGFTMAIFIADLAFRDDSTRGTAKVGVLAASLVAALLALLFGRVALPERAGSAPTERG